MMVAEIFSRRGTGVTHMAVGTSDEPESEAFSTLALVNDGSAGEPLTGATEVAIPAEAFLPPELDGQRRLVRVRVRATLPPEAAVGIVREAALLSRNEERTILYNRVTFAPIAKGPDHELTLFWEVSFPYGDLPWLG